MFTNADLPTILLLALDVSFWYIVRVFSRYIHIFYVLLKIWYMFIICPNFTTQGEFNLMEITRNNQRLSSLDLSLLSTLWFNMQIRSQTVCLFITSSDIIWETTQIRPSDWLSFHRVVQQNRTTKLSPYNLCLADLLLPPAEWKQTHKQTHKLIVALPSGECWRRDKTKNIWQSASWCLPPGLPIFTHFQSRYSRFIHINLMKYIMHVRTLQLDL